VKLMNQETNAASLALPWKAHFRFYWNVLAKRSYIIAVFVVHIICLGAALLALRLTGTGDIPLWVFWLSMEGLALFLIVPSLLLIPAISRARLLVDEEGITTRSVRGKHHVRWRDARLFVLLQNGNYELTSPYDTVTLESLPFLYKAAMRPDMSFEEYERQMVTLLRLISERTGLPLSDLRDMNAS
jgi:hypothetical protein